MINENGSCIFLQLEDLESRAWHRNSALKLTQTPLVTLYAENVNVNKGLFEDSIPVYQVCKKNIVTIVVFFVLDYILHNFKIMQWTRYDWIRDYHKGVLERFKTPHWICITCTLLFSIWQHPCLVSHVTTLNSA